MGFAAGLFLIAVLLTSGIGLSVSAEAEIQGGEDTATALEPNVVKITANVQEDRVQTGFGFIVGQQENFLVIVTADHVVRGDDPGAEDKQPLVTFFENQGSQVRGALQTVRLPKNDGDVAVLLVPRPAGVSFLTNVLDTRSAARGLRVWSIGRLAGWNIPVQPGVVSQIDSFTGRIGVEDLRVRVGSSGGPLI
jgi:Trypsin-like peptidase domain